VVVGGGGGEREREEEDGRVVVVVSAGRAGKLWVRGILGAPAGRTKIALVHPPDRHSVESVRTRPGRNLLKSESSRPTKRAPPEHRGIQPAATSARPKEISKERFCVFARG
jgi:hypothetical protein